MNTRLAVVGCGLISSKYVIQWLTAYPELTVPVVADYSEKARVALADQIESLRGIRPRCVKSADEAVKIAKELDLNSMYIATPHSSHYSDVCAGLNGGLDVLIEKPLAFQREQVEKLIKLRDEVGATLVVAYNGSLSPLLDRAAAIVESKELGELRSVHGAVWQNWKERYNGQWKQQPEISGGGFLIDTGVHLLNALCHVMKGTPEKVCGLSDEPAGNPEFVTAFLGQFKGNVPVTVVSCGDSYPVCQGWLELIFNKGRFRLECWGRWLEIVKSEESSTSPIVAESDVERLTADSILGPMDTFMQVRAGKIANPSPAERSLEVAALWEAVVSSGQGDGAWTKVAS